MAACLRSWSPTGPGHASGFRTTARDSAGRIRADEAAFQVVALAQGDVDAELVDDETANRHADARGDESAGAVARVFAVELDQQHGVVARQLRVGARSRLGVAVDGHGAGDAGSSEVGMIVCTPAPGMLKSIVSAPALALASRIAWRSEPGPESLVFVTVKVAAATGPR